MSSWQFSIKHLLILLTFIGVSIATLRILVTHFPWMFYWFLLWATTIGLLGVGILAFSAILTVSVYMNPDTKDKRQNLSKCANLALIGMLMLSPLLVAIVTIPAVTQY